MGVGDNDAILLLRYFKWNLEKLQEQWFSDGAAKIAKFIGIEFDTSIGKNYPFTTATLKAHNQGYC